MKELFYIFNGNQAPKKPKQTLYMFYEVLIFYFSYEAAKEVVSIHESSTNEHYNNLYNGLVDMSGDELLAKMKCHHPEVVLPFITVFLWKKRLGFISEDLVFELDESFEEDIASLHHDYTVRNIHKMMSMAGDENIVSRRPRFELDGECESYGELVEKLLSDYSYPSGIAQTLLYDPPEILSLLVELLGIVGTEGLKKLNVLDESIAFVDYVIREYETDINAQWIYIEHFVYLLFILGIDSSEAFECFKKMLSRDSHLSYLTMTLGLKVFGVRAFELFKKRTETFDYFLGYDNYVRLVQMPLLPKG